MPDRDLFTKLKPHHRLAAQTLLGALKGEEFDVLLVAVALDKSLEGGIPSTRAPCARSDKEMIQAQLFSLIQRHAAEVLSFYERERPRSLPRQPRRTGAQQCLPLSR